MTTKVLVNRPGSDPKSGGIRETFEFGRIPVVGESIRLGDGLPMFRVTYVLHTPLDQDSPAEVFVEINHHFENAHPKAPKR